MKSKVQAFLKSEGGAVTVDWVVLTAAIVGLGLIVAIPISSAADGEAVEIGEYLTQVAADQ